MTQTAVNIPQNDIESLDKFYTFTNRTEILHFLAQYPFLVPILLEAPDKIRPYFPNTELVLEFTRDPENADDEQLFLNIIIDSNADEAIDEALDKEEKFSVNWYLTLPYNVREIFWCGVA